MDLSFNPAKTKILCYSLKKGKKKVNFEVQIHVDISHCNLSTFVYKVARIIQTLSPKTCFIPQYFEMLLCWALLLEHSTGNLLRSFVNQT